MPTVAHHIMQADQPSGEICQFGFWLWGDDATDDDYVASAAAFQDALSEDTDWAALFPADTAFTEGKLYIRDQTTGALTNILPAGSAYAGSSIDGPLPPQIREVVTFRTNLLTSDGRGRMYLPTVNHGCLTTTGLMDDDTRDQIVSSVAAAFLASQIAPVFPVVYSMKLRSVAAITSIDVGNVYDTQRRGRDKLVEARTSSTIT